MKALGLPLARPIGTAAVYAAIFWLGLYALHGMPLALAPELDPPSLSVRIAWVNATPEEMEGLVTARIEAEAEQLSGVRDVASVSGQGWAQIDLEFEPHVRMDRAEVFLRERLAALRDELPADVQPPEVMARQAQEMEGERFLVLRAGGPRSAEGLRQLLEERVAPRLLAVPGVAGAAIYGGAARELRADLQKDALGRGLVSPGAVSSALDRMAGLGGLGAATAGLHRVPSVLRPPNPSATALRRQIVGGAATAPLFLGDVGRVHDGWQDPLRIARVDGEPAVQVALDREPGTNVIRVAGAVHRALADLAPGLPPDVKVEVLYDQSERIRAELDALGRRSVFSIVAIFLVLVVVHGRVRAPLVVLAAVLFSTLLTFLLFRATGLGMNLVTLSGLALAFGMAVDSSIVLLQNIAQRAGGRPHRAVTLAAVREVLLPLLAGTATIAVVMVPFLYVSGDLRTYYMPFVLAVCLSLLASFFVGTTLTPLLSRWSLAGARPLAASSTLRTRLWSLLECGYAQGLDRSLRRPWIPITVAVLLFAASLWVFQKRVGHGSMFASDPETGIRVSASLPPGNDLEATEAMLSRFERAVLEHPFYLQRHIEQVQLFMAEGRGMLLVRFAPGMALTAVPEAMQTELTGIAAAISGAEVSVSGYGPGFSSNRSRATPSYQLTVRGPDYMRLAELAGDLGRRLSSEARVREIDTNASSWLVDTASDLALVPDRSRMAQLGVTMADLVATLQPAIAGRLADRDLPTTSGDVPVRVRLEDGLALTREELLSTFGRTSAGVAFPLGEVLTVEERPVQAEIRRRAQQYERVITFDYRGPRPVGNRYVQSFLKNTAVPPGYTLEDGTGLFLSGVEERQVARALALALLLVYMVAAALFESLRLPFVALLAVPLGFTGIAASFWASGESFDRGAWVGLILLVGIAINSSLLLVHRAGRLLRRGLERGAAIRRAALERCRPIALTTATSVAGLLPLALAGRTDGGDAWHALALSAAAGLAASALVTLAVVPALFMVISPPRSRRSRKLGSLLPEEE